MAVTMKMAKVQPSLSLPPSLPLSACSLFLCCCSTPTGQTAAKPDTQTFATFKDDDVGDLKDCELDDYDFA